MDAASHMTQAEYDALDFVEQLTAIQARTAPAAFLAKMDAEIAADDARRARKQAEEAARYAGLSTDFSDFKVCGRCSGQRKIQCYSHVAGGICFACEGSGYLYKR